MNNDDADDNERQFDDSTVHVFTIEKQRTEHCETLERGENTKNGNEMKLNFCR